jgi:rhodanese-related sulfurtransferase
MAQAVTASLTREVDPQVLQEWLLAGQAVVIDVREPNEFAAGHIPGSQSMPLSSFDPQAVPASGAKKVVLHCAAGSRAGEACKQMAAIGREDVYLFRAGMQGWQAANLPVEGSGKKVIDVMRQVQLVVGAMILTSVLLGHFVAPGWLVLAGFAGCGLLLAGATGECPLALVLAKMPWNSGQGASCPLQR